MRYTGGKNGAGVFHTILRQVPPHRVFVEAFGGSAALTRRKAAVERSVVIEADGRQVDRLRTALAARPDVEVRHGCAFQMLAGWQWQGDEFVYLDPPYLHSTRSNTQLYRHELNDEQHVELLELVARLPVPFALSGYRNDLYDQAAARHGWRRVDFQAMTHRRRPATESLWMNYAEPEAISDPDFAGATFRERQRIKRKAERWVSRFQALPALERQAICERLAAAGIVISGDEISTAGAQAGSEP